MHGPVPDEEAGVEVELVNGNHRIPVRSLPLLPFPDLCRVAVPEPGKGDVGREAPEFRRETGSAGRPLHLFLKRRKRRILLQADPENPRLFPRREMADTPERQGKGRTADRSERLSDALEQGIVRIAQEAQGEMVLIRGHPARPFQITVEGRKLICRFLGKINCREQPIHGLAPP